MAKVEVHNLNEYPFKQQFRDEVVEIPANSYVTMEYEEAILFKGMINDVVRDGDGNILPQSYKKLKIVQDGSGKQMMEEARKKAEAFKCQACGFQANSKQELHIHTKEEHLSELQDPKVAKQLQKAK